MQAATQHQPAPITIGGRAFAWGERTYIMGVLNVTPDSFSGDGVGTDVDEALRRAVRMSEDGADMVDVGGESTRPGAEEIDAEEELRRTIPVVERLARELDVPVSIDTYKADVAKAAIEAGAALVNDVHGFRREPRLAAVAAEAGVPVVAMHYQRGREFKDTIGSVIDITLAPSAKESTLPPSICMIPLVGSSTGSVTSPPSSRARLRRPHARRATSP